MAYETHNPQHDLHVTDWLWAMLHAKRPVLASALDPLFTIEPNRYNRSDLTTRPNWDLPS